MEDYNKYAQIGYEAYCKACEWKAFNGDQLKPWNEIPQNIKNYWLASVKAILGTFMDN